MAANAGPDTPDSADGELESHAQIVDRVVNSSVDTITSDVEAGRLTHTDLERFCKHAAAGRYDPPPGVVAVVRVVCALLDDRDRLQQVPTEN